MHRPDVDVFDACGAGVVHNSAAADPRHRTARASTTRASRSHYSRWFAKGMNNLLLFGGRVKQYDSIVRDVARFEGQDGITDPGFMCEIGSRSIRNGLNGFGLHRGIDERPPRHARPTLRKADTLQPQLQRSGWIQSLSTEVYQFTEERQTKRRLLGEILPILPLRSPEILLPQS